MNKINNINKCVDFNFNNKIKLLEIYSVDRIKGGGAL